MRMLSDRPMRQQNFVTQEAMPPASALLCVCYHCSKWRRKGETYKLAKTIRYQCSFIFNDYIRKDRWTLCLLGSILRQPFPPAPALAHTDMSGNGRARTSSFAEPPGAPGAAAAAAGSAVAGGSSAGKSGASQATGSSSSGFGNLKLTSEYS